MVRCGDWLRRQNKGKGQYDAMLAVHAREPQRDRRLRVDCRVGIRLKDVVNSQHTASLAGRIGRPQYVPVDIAIAGGGARRTIRGISSVSRRHEPQLNQNMKFTHS